MNQETIDQIYVSNPIMKEALTDFYQNKRLNKKDNDWFYYEQDNQI